MKAKQLIEAYSEALTKGDISKSFSFFAPDAK